MERNCVGNIDFLMLGSNLGLHTLTLENGLPVMDTLTTHELGDASVLFQFVSDSFDPGVLIMGKDGVWRTTFSESEQSLSTSEIIFVESLSSMLSDSNATATSAGHAKIFGRTPILLIGSDFGLIAWNSSDGSDNNGMPWWVFTRNNADEFVSPDILDTTKTATVNSIMVESSEQGSDDVWVGMGGGRRCMGGWEGWRAVPSVLIVIEMMPQPTTEQ